MRTLKIYAAAFVMILASGVAKAQDDDSGLPGDHFSLEGALELFKKSSSPEEFEKLLNSEENKVNNLDLNGDGEIDYVRVIDKNEGDVHAFILQAAISENENQDVAVIELEKNEDGKATLQIVGDEDIYGQETIIEPTENVKVNAGASTNTTVVNVWAWPAVRYVYAPGYRVYASPWGWSARPTWYRPWRPVSRVVYRPYWAPYRPHYTVVKTHRVVVAPRIYRPVRTTSVTVTSRHSKSVNNYRATQTNTRVSRGNKTVTRKRTSVEGPKGNRVTRKTTRVKRGRE